MDLDYPWADEMDDGTIQNNEWEKMSSEFTNTGYREGITAGKEAALQKGFDVGFADVGVPIGHNLGVLRGLASGLSSYLSMLTTNPSLGPASEYAQTLQEEVRVIGIRLNDIRFSDIAPPDTEAEEHARVHLEQTAADIIEDETLLEKKELELLEDMLSSMGTTSSTIPSARPTMQSVVQIYDRLHSICKDLEIDIGADTPSPFLRS